MMGPVMPKRKRKKASARAPLSRARAIEQAVALADAEGIAEVTMRKFAQALGVEAMSLYHHVASKDDILNGMVDFIFEQVELPVPEVLGSSQSGLVATHAHVHAPAIQR